MNTRKAISTNLKMSKLYTWTPEHFYFYIPRITADFFGYPVQTVVIPKDDERTKDKEWIAKKGHGKFPIFEDENGEVIYESGAIAAHIARVSGNEDFLGNSAWERAEVNQFVSVGLSGAMPSNIKVVYNVFGFKNDAASYGEGVEAIQKQAKLLESALGEKDWFVGGRFTLADLVLFVTLAPAFSFVLDAAFREEIPNLAAWFEKVSKLPAVAGVAGYIKPCEQALKPAFK